MKYRSVAVAALAAIGLFGALAVQSAQAVTVSIGLSDGVGGPGLVASGVNSTVISGGTFNGFEFGVTAAGNPPQPDPIVLNSTSLDTRLTGTGTGTLDVYVTVSGITGITGLNFWTSAFTVLASTASSLTLSTYLDTNNGVFQTSGAGVFALGSFGPVGPSGLLTDADQSPQATAGTFSVTALYHIVTSAVGQIANAAISVAVPGPIVGAGLPGLLIACGALLLLARRRRQMAV